MNKENPEILTPEMLEEEAEASEDNESFKNNNEAKYLDEIRNLNEKILRIHADTENMRKRYEKQLEESAKFAVSTFAKSLINVHENLHRTLSHLNPELVENNAEVKAIYDGILMTEKELSAVFEKQGIMRLMPEVGDMFNHEIHQAVAQVPNEELNEGAIVNIVQAGYIINGRLLKPAMVVVAKSA